MSLLVRKIDCAKWFQKDVLGGEAPSADAITNCMKTSDNKLSVWKIANEDEIEDAVIAIASQFDNLSTIDVLPIDIAVMEEQKLPLIESPGVTPYARFAERHLDVAELDYKSLGVMSDIIVALLKQERQSRFTVGKLKKILADAVAAGKINWAELRPSVQKKIPQPSAAE